MKALRRALASFRLGPRSFLAGLRTTQRLSPEDAADADQLAGFFGPPPAPATDGRHLLLLSYQALPYALKMEALLARALQAEGWRVSVVASPATEPFARAYHGRVLGAEVHCLEDFLPFRPQPEVAEAVRAAQAAARRDLGEFKALTWRGAPLALHAVATLSAARPDGVIHVDADNLRLLGRYLRRSMLLLEAAGRLFDQLRPDLALGIEKGFVGTCEAYYEALNRGTDYVQWVGCHEPESIMLKRYRRDNARDHPFSISDGNWAKLRRAPWQDHYRERVMTEFERGYREGAWFRYKSIGGATDFPGRDELQARIGVDAARKTAVIYSHILSDANLFYGNDLFVGGYEQWLVETVRTAAENPRVNWVLKIHPANVVRNRRLGYGGEYGELLALERAFGRVPEFLRVVRPEDGTSPFAFFGITDWGITVRGTVGLELPCLGIPVLTAGTGRYSGKGFTVDSASTGEYLGRIRSIDRIAPLSPEEVRLGQCYAYNVFQARPARYGEVCRDTYEGPAHGRRYRNLAFRAGTAGEVLSHPQIRAIARFLASSEDEFLEDPAGAAWAKMAAVP